jgi:hypothetical protein
LFLDVSSEKSLEISSFASKPIGKKSAI